MNALLETDRRAVFRCDASTTIGGGHVMRCLTLAGALRTQGWWCGFAVAPETPDVVPRLRAEASAVLLLDDGGEAEAIGQWTCAHADLLVVDHYRRDAAFESACRPWAERIAVIDDLADRPHDADLLLDQTYGRDATDYDPWVPASCRVLCGSTYALLRPSFARLRADALARRAAAGPARRLLVALGATDPGNLTAVVLDVIARCGLDLIIDVVLGAGAPHRQRIASRVAGMPQSARLHLGVEDMAPLIAAADLAIGAAGTSAWERCCLGLPSIVVEIADNQRLVAERLDRSGACRRLNRRADEVASDLTRTLNDLVRNGDARRAMAHAASAIVDGRGTGAVIDAILST